MAAPPEPARRAGYGGTDLQSPGNDRDALARALNQAVAQQARRFRRRRHTRKLAEAAPDLLTAALDLVQGIWP